MGILSAFLKTGTVLFLGNSLKNSNKFNQMLENTSKLISRDNDVVKKISSFLVFGVNRDSCVDLRTNKISSKKGKNEKPVDISLTDFHAEKKALELLLTTYLLIFFMELFVTMLKEYSFILNMNSIIFAAFKTILILLISSYSVRAVTGTISTEETFASSNGTSMDASTSSVMTSFGLKTIQEKVKSLICSGQLNYIPLVVYFTMDSIF